MIMFHVNLPGTQNKKETQLENTHFRLKHDDGHHLQGSDFEQKTIRDPMFFLLWHKMVVSHIFLIFNLI